MRLSRCTSEQVHSVGFVIHDLEISRGESDPIWFVYPFRLPRTQQIPIGAVNENNSIRIDNSACRAIAGRGDTRSLLGFRR